MYGLKKAPQGWYEKIDWFFVNNGFKHYEFDVIINVLHVEGNKLIVVVYVDDSILTRSNFYLIFRLKRWLVDNFEMKYISILHFFLGLHVLPLSNGLLVS